MKTYFKWALSILSVTWMGAMLCFGPPPAPKNSPYPLPPSPEPSRRSPRVTISEHVIELEKAFLLDLQRGDVFSLERALTDDCQIVDADGRSYGKSELLSWVPKEGRHLYTAMGFVVGMPSKDTAAVTYKVDVTELSAQNASIQHLSVHSNWKRISSAKNERYDWKLVSRQSSLVQ